MAKGVLRSSKRGRLGRESEKSGIRHGVKEWMNKWNKKVIKSLMGE